MPASKTPPASKSAVPVRSSPPRAKPAGNPPRQAETRWQRSARYVWDKGGSRGGR
ncbi:MAG: hypothetical protein AW12_02627 [Candidatus Accumulibacter sp. BA-94]|jgi:hypothetical protein|uniref:hypothetical protein n=1 Tax=Accumulibacter sp. TaxID=2053492 RepID=UPI00044A7879|nr:hypothetical protein [Accumulibacter sp.]EXI83165.1 MAG: hypothetical protein AW12_02627 [Candidatus Accumulibacter sp. BA-94]HRD90387.1 hypothetical protein [Accumulibacter sp.]